MTDRNDIPYKIGRMLGGFVVVGIFMLLFKHLPFKYALAIVLGCIWHEASEIKDWSRK